MHRDAFAFGGEAVSFQQSHLVD